MKEIVSADIQVVAVSYDSVAVLEKFAGSQNIKFPLLSDEKSEVIKAFGVLNEDAGGRSKGIPHPGTFVIDSKGIVQAKLPGTVRTRHTTDQLLEVAKELGR
jgi:peroxiredoxin